MSSSSTSPQCKHEVFVSFRGKDERDKFISYLCHWLKEEGINYFYDKDAEHAGKKIEDIIFPAIRHARVALVVLSENYANSTWCLYELVEILRCNSELKNHNLVVIPIFYHVDPADVENLTNKSNFERAFHGLCQKVKNDEQIRIWKNALAKVTEFSGFAAKDFGTEVGLLDAITQSLNEKICPRRSLNFAKNVIGADRLVDDVIPLLKIGREDVRVIGISGTEGIGKTMVARAVCKGTLNEFERFIFLDKVGNATQCDLVNLQKKLLQNLNKVNGQTPCDGFHGNINEIKNKLRDKKILLVLDGVTQKKQMRDFGAEDRESFCLGSRILITTSDRDLLNDLKVDDRYIVEGLNRDEAFRLFCRHAFKREEPEEGYEELSRYLAHYAGGHPLALEKWGSFLNGRLNPDQWREVSKKLLNNPDLINSIGPDLGRIFKEYPSQVVGPCGGDRSAGTWKDEGHTGVRKIEVGFDSEAIKFITIVYDKKGRERKPVTHGTKRSGTSTLTIQLNCPSEYLTYISGRTKEVSGGTILQSLTFHTNRGKRELIGTSNEGKKISFPYTGRKIVGFYGSCNGSHLESIGAIYMPIPHTPIGYSGRVFGPFGGAGEKSWDSNDINGISVRYTDFISKITFKVNNDTSSKPQTTYGENGRKFKVKLENSSEYITSFSGYFENANDGRILINSLTFQTNKRILGPIGREEGKHFSSPSEAVKVTRFFGREDGFLESIGAQVKQYYPFKSVGLFGCSNASDWNDRDDDYTNVRKIIVEFAPQKTFIRSITFHYAVKNERLLKPKRHPGIPAEGIEPQTIQIDADEYLISMSGYYMEGGITSLTFRTNKRTLDLIAREEGINFSSPATGGKIVGFYGSSGKNLEAIGAYFQPIPELYPVKSIGPFGGSSGDTRDGSSEETWDYRKFKGVREIEVKHDINIHYIKFVYYDGNDQGHSVTYGYTKGGILEVPPVSLDYPREYLISISGYARNEGGIQSLTFYSNKSRYGPYGKEEGKYFWYPSNGSRIAGFHGTRDKTLKFIGVYVEPIPHLYPFKTVGPFGGSGGTPWDDGVHTDVRGFRISFGKAIKAIGIAYDNNGSFVSGSEHGIGYDNRGSFVLGLKPGKEPREKYMEVLLDYPRERLISISVWVEKDKNPGQPIIHDLTIFTTKDRYGPFIPESWQKRDKLMRFYIPLENNCGRIVGFYGSVGRYLNSIGARLEPY